MPQRRAHAVGARIAAADHDHVLAAGREIRLIGEVRIEQALRITREKVHRVVDADQIATRAAARGVERFGSAGAEQHGVELVDQVLRVDELHFAAALLHDLRHVAVGEIFLLADVGA